ncbi:MAG: alpha-2-macroglobulin family protein [Armatimonadota bacterium]|nr:alpha-2-macroglobulin family protein [Armatimonadota bacterium]
MPRSVISRQWLAIAAAVFWCGVILAFVVAQETPTGDIRGKVYAVETGRPIADARIYLRSVETTDGDHWESRHEETDANGEFKFEDLPVAEYVIEANADVHSVRPVNVTVTEGQIEELDLEMAPGQPYLNLYASQRSFTTKERPEIALDGFTPGDHVSVELHRIDIDKLISGTAGSVRDVLRENPSPSGKKRANPPAILSSESLTVAIDKRDSEGIYHRRVKFEPHAPGLYIISAEADGIRRGAWLSVSDISLVSKNSSSQMLAYAVTPDTGQPVPGTQVKVIRDDKTIASGTTDATGIWRAGMAASGKPEYETIYVVARKGDSVAVLGSEGYTSRSEGATIYTYTDRPVYRPGHQVRFRGIVRKFSKDAYHTPMAGQVRVEARDRRDTLVYAKSLPLSRFGSFHGDFSLPQFSATGEYQLNCTFEKEQQSASFAVAEYRKPEFTVSVQTPKKRYVRGDTVKAKIRATYYFGAPVVGAEVRYSISRSDYWAPWDEGEDGYDWGYEGEYDDYGGYGEEILSGTLVTGPDGTAEVEFKARWKQEPDDYSPADQEFSIHAFVTDQSRREAEGDASVIATLGDFRVDVNAVEYIVNPGNSARFKIRAADYGRGPRAGVQLDIMAGLVSWEDGEENYGQVASAKTSTDAAGRAIFAFTPRKEGQYMVRVTCRDRRGRLLKSSAWLWVPGTREFAGYKYPSLEVVLDKKVYKPGDTAKVLINSAQSGVAALVTVEGRRLFDHKLVKLDRRSTVVNIPIKPEYRPNFYVTVCYVKDKKLVSAEDGAKVSLAEQSLKLTVTPNKRKYEPGEQAVYLLRTVNSRGKPVQAEVSLGVVDEAIYAIREENTTPIRDLFYSRQPNNVNTRYSFPEVYYSADKGGFTGRIRKEFVDTAFWRADVVTDKKGEARVRFKMPDNLTTWRATARACTADTVVGQTTNKTICSKKLLVRLTTPRFLVQKDESVVSAAVHNYLPKPQRVEVTIYADGAVSGKSTHTVTVGSEGVERVDWRITAPGTGAATFTAYAVARDANDAMQLTIPVRPHGQRLVETRSGSTFGSPVNETLIIRSDSVAGASQIRIRLAPSLASSMLGSLEYLAQYPYGCTEQTMSSFLPDVVIWRSWKAFGVENPDLKRKLPDMVGKGLNRLYDFQHEDTGGWGWCEYGQDDLWMTAYVVFGLLTAREAGFHVNRDALERGLESLERQLKRKPRRIEESQSARIYALYVLSTGGRKQTVRNHIHSVLTAKKVRPEQNALLAMTLANISDTAAARDYLTELWSQAIVTGGEIHWGRRYHDYYGYYDEIPTQATAQALMAVQRITPNDSRIPKIVRWLLRNRRYNHWYSTRDTAMILYALSDYLSRSKELQPNFVATISHNNRFSGEFRFDRRSLFQPEEELVIHPISSETPPSPTKTVPGVKTIPRIHDELRPGYHYFRINLRGRGALYYTIETTQYVRRPEKRKVAGGSGITVTREYRKLVSRWDESYRRNRLQPADSPSADLRSGDTYRVRLVIRSPRQYYHLLVEDYLPAGCEAFDRGRVDPWEWSYWWVDQDVRDERVSFYLETLPRGKSLLEYEFRAGIPGRYNALPALVEAMYDPSITAIGKEDEVRVR